SAFEYSPQENTSDDMYVYAESGSAVTMESNIGGGDATVYTWIMGADNVVGDMMDYTIDAYDPATHSGTYYCLGQNSNVPGLDIMTGKMMLWENSLAPDSLALVALYDDCGGAAWGDDYANWMTDSLSNWTGVTVSWVLNEAMTDSAMRVTQVAFKNMTLTGTLPAELGNMTEMSGKIEMLDQAGLTGEFPAFFWNWTKVERMQIKHCGFTSIDVTGIEMMVNLYEFNTQATPFEGEIPAEIFELPLMRDVYLEDGMWTSLPAELPIPTTTPLRRFYLNGNQFTDLPDLTGMVWAEGAKIKFRTNYLTFEDLEPNMWIADDVNVDAFEISPQAVLTDKETITVDEGDPVSMAVSCGGSENMYTWVKDGVPVDGASTDQFDIAAALAADAGEYYCLVQSALVPGLDIVSDTFTVVVNIIEGVEKFSTGFVLNGNPVKHQLSIDADQLIDQVIISDITGKVVRNEMQNSSIIRMEVGELKHGVYFVTLRSASQDQVVKIIKQ
ncbi:MAG: T9SS type A sorting domain-containing protein, partial [Bacteroides sp.]|nr:T9SS type A sorting domain-containing protein [Bacteroides sp.]